MGQETRVKVAWEDGMSYLMQPWLQAHLIRALIAGLTLISLLFEGWLADSMTMSAVLLWLWLPEWQSWLCTHWVLVKKAFITL